MIMDIVDKLKSIEVDVTPFSRRYFIKKGADTIEDLRQQLAVKDLEVMQLREALGIASRYNAIGDVDIERRRELLHIINNALKVTP